MTAPILDDPAAYFSFNLPERVVSLTPSMTESLFDLGMGGVVVGITDYCTRPEAAVASLPRVGGTKNPRVDTILTLKPDLVIANREENARETIEALCAADVPVWLTFPRTVQAVIGDLYALARLFRKEQSLLQVQTLERSIEWAGMALPVQPPARYFCPIWQDCAEGGKTWWMTFNDDTFSGDLLRLLGGENIFAQRQRRYPLLADLGEQPAEDPGDRDTRYPRVTVEEVSLAQPDVILLPDEPYSYSNKSVESISAAFEQTPAAQNGRIIPLDGSLITWPGTRLAKALETLPSLFAV